MGRPRVTGTMVQTHSRISTIDKPPGNRWEAVDKAAEFVCSDTQLVVDSNLLYLLGKAGVDVALVPMLVRGLHAQALVLWHSWFNKPSEDTATFGRDPPTIKLIAALESSWMKAMLLLIASAPSRPRIPPRAPVTSCNSPPHLVHPATMSQVEVFKKVLQPTFYLARLNESGGGACLLLAHRTFVLEKCREVIEYTPYLLCIAEAKKLPQLQQTLFAHGVNRILRSMQERAQAQWERSATTNLLLGIAHLAIPVANLIYEELYTMKLVDQHSALPLVGDTVLAPFSCGNKIFTLNKKAPELMDDIRAALTRSGGFEKLAFVQELFVEPGTANCLPGFVKYFNRGCTFDLSNRETLSDPFYLLHTEALTVANGTSLKTETDVNMMEEVLRGVKSKVTPHAMAQRILTESQRQRLRRLSQARVTYIRHLQISQSKEESKHSLSETLSLPQSHI